jgi:hypothetical protein
MIEISFPSGSIRLREVKANESVYFVEADCSSATVSEGHLKVVDVTGDLRVWSGGDECRGEMEVTLHDENKGEDLKYQLRFAPMFFQAILTRMDFDDDSMRIEDCERTGGYGSPSVCAMGMTITCHDGLLKRW